MANKPLTQRQLMAKVQSSLRIMPEDDPVTPGCHLWTGLIDKGGYSRINVHRKPMSVHKWLWEVTYDVEVTWDNPLDHVCHNLAVEAGTCLGGASCLHRRCVNLEHLEQSSRQSNTSGGLIGHKRQMRAQCRLCQAELSEVDKQHEGALRMGTCIFCRRAYDRNRARRQRRLRV